MDRLFLKTAGPGDKTIEDIYTGLRKRVAAGERGVCPVDLTAVFLRLCQSQSCGKCTPCRVGVDRMAGLLEGMLDGDGTYDDIKLLKRTASVIVDSADCAIGFEAAKVVLGCIGTYYQDFESHITTGSCMTKHQAVRCAWNCPAQVDIPGYIALCKVGRFVDGVRLIRKDNPFPSTCALICEHPFEHFSHPVEPYPARRTLAAALGLAKPQEYRGQINRAYPALACRDPFAKPRINVFDCFVARPGGF